MNEQGFRNIQVSRRGVVKGAAVAGAMSAAAGISVLRPAGQTAAQSEIEQIAQERGLTPDDVSAALKTYVPSGKRDEYLIFASGGHSGQVLVIGVPSMRILKYIAVFTPEPWQGYGFGDEHEGRARRRRRRRQGRRPGATRTTRRSPRPTATTTASSSSSTTRPTRASR